jgi:DNA-binding transcriptional MerR regulator
VIEDRLRRDRDQEKPLPKSPDAFRTISEVADDLDLPQHVLRFWETRFPQIKPLKRGGGRRYYRPDDIDLLRGIRHLLYGEGYTIRGVQRILKEQGARFVVAAGRGDLLQLPARAPEEAFDEEVLPPALADVEAERDRTLGEPHREPPEVVVDVERDDQEPDERPAEGGVIGVTRRLVDRLIDRAPAAPAAGLSRDDVERLQASLGELLECKRLLDSVR